MNYVQLSMADLPKKIRYDSDDKFLAFIQSIRGTSTDIERIFFFCGNSVSPRRTRLNKNLFESIIIVNKFYK